MQNKNYNVLYYIQSVNKVHIYDFYLLSSSLEAKQKYSSIQLISQENVETKPYNGKDYRLYGKVDLETNLVTKITKLFQFIAVALLIPATCGVIIAFTSYQDLLKRKLQAISKTTVNIYVLEILKESIASQPQKSPAKDPKMKGMRRSHLLK
ncbi:MAG: hypothetical protein HWD61_01110 [Parachlamydiaceae bacterium]|nr:MAG: hypothetical protein HWD61_01110 [Parachlamydiaceae bacterium]